MNPEGETGKRFWERIYEKVYDVGAIHELPLQETIESFNKVWIIPDIAEVYQNGDAAYIVNAKLKVMMEGDYIAHQQSELSSQRKLGPSVFQNDLTTNDTGSRVKPGMTDNIKDIIRSTILPIIEDEVNNGPSFAPLRQIYHSMILAKWYEQHFKNSVLGQSYVDRNTVEGIKLSSPNASVGDPFLKDISAKDNGFPTKALGNDNSVQDIYNQYVVAYKQGAYDLIKDDYDPAKQEVVTRKYFSGGIVGNVSFQTARFNSAMLSSPAKVIAVALKQKPSVSAGHSAMLVKKEPDVQFMKKLSELLRPVQEMRKILQNPHSPKDSEEERIIEEGLGNLQERIPNLFKERNKNSAMLNSAPGGIDLNALDISTQGQATPMQAPLNPAMLQKPLNLTPRIIHIGTVNVYDFLGLNRPADGGPDDANSLMPDTELLAVKEDS